MKVVFIKEEAGRYFSRATRSDSAIIEIPGPDRPRDLPHDLVHFIVEDELRLEYGFWDRLAKGGVLKRGMSYIGGKKKPGSKKRSEQVGKDAGQNLTQAEVLVDVFYRIIVEGLDRDLLQARSMVSSSWRPEKGAAGPFTDKEILDTCERLKKAWSTWSNLKIGGSLELDWVELEKR